MFKATISQLLATATMRCVLSLALGLLALEAVLAQDPNATPALYSCPAINPAEEIPCTRSCNNNNDCMENTICCPSVCGRTCKAAVKVEVKAGSCPWISEISTPEQCLMENQCARDADCSGNQKCCKRGCAMMCLNPVLENNHQSVACSGSSDC